VILLDLFCGAGGAGAGYARAGFEVVGIDNRPQPHYPFRFVQADALDPSAWLEATNGRAPDVVHASPPCQRYAVSTQVWQGLQETHADLVDPTRDMLEAAGVPFVIENVPGAPLRNPLTLCGTMFEGLRVYRHRVFETSPVLWWPPAHYPHRERVTEVGRPALASGWMTVAGHFANLPAASAAMGIDWMTVAELAQAIPPAYTEWLGSRLLVELGVRP
jgi:DNA (cytosine-5)-methyltransferase 1